jgi:hypothetical protein
MNNINELRQSLSDNYTQMKSGNMKIALGKELSNAAGKILSSVKVELEYAKMLNEKPDIQFLNDPAKKKGK